MSSTTVPPEAVRKYGFNIYKEGRLIREQVVPAGNAAIAEARVHRYLADGEYPWYAVPRLIEDRAAVGLLPIDTNEGIADDQGGVAA